MLNTSPTTTASVSTSGSNICVSNSSNICSDNDEMPSKISKSTATDQSSTSEQSQKFTYFNRTYSCVSDSNIVEEDYDGAEPAKFQFGPGFQPHPSCSNPSKKGYKFTENLEAISNEDFADEEQYVVFFHVNQGVTISFQMGDSVELLQGPVVVPMVSTNSSPPIAMPVQVPPGHVVQQIVDENGTLRHVILSPQHSPGLIPLTSHPNPHYAVGSVNGTNLSHHHHHHHHHQQQPQQAQQPPQQTTFYQNLPTPFITPSHYHCNLSPSHSITPANPTQLTRTEHSPPLNTNFYKDERTQKQYNKLRKKIYDKQKKGEDVEQKNDVNDTFTSTAPPPPPPPPPSVVDDKGVVDDGTCTSEDGEESSIPDEDEDDSIQTITDLLSSVQAPKVSELSSRSALLQWAPPTRLKSELTESDDTGPTDTTENCDIIDISESELRYEVLLSDKSKEMKFKSIYSGVSLSCRIQDLRPGQEYSVCLQAHLDELQGSATDPVKFVTPPCEPDRPQPPKLHQRLKNSLQLRWASTNDNGAPIVSYVLEYDEGNPNNEFIEFHRGRVKQFNVQKLQAGTAYRFRLCAINEVGTSSYSDIVTYYTCQNAPHKPTSPQLVEAYVDRLHLKWEKRTNDDEFTLQMNDNTHNYYLPVYNGREATYICTNLAKFTEYRFRLRAENDGGQSAWSDETVLRTLPGRPGRPTKPLVKGRIHAHSFKLKWEGPTDTGGADITKYVLELNSGSGYRTIYTGQETEATCDRLTPGTTYQLRVSCQGTGGGSSYSDPCTVTTDAICPGKCPTPRTVGKPKPDSVQLKWSEPDYNGGAPVLEYELALVDPDTNRNTIVYKNKQMECVINANISPGCCYHFVVRAINRIGPGPWSDVVKVTSGAAAPSTMEAPQIMCKTPFHIVLEWSEPMLNGAPILEYNLEMLQCDNSTPSSLDCEDDNSNFRSVYQGTERNHHLKGLNPITTYQFRVRAINSAGSSSFSLRSSITTPPAPPSTITTIHASTTPTTIQLNWHAPNSNGAPILSYNIDIGDRTICTRSAQIEYQLLHLEPNTLYKIRIQAVNEVGNGTFSSTLRVVTPRLPPAPPKLECIGVGSNFLKLKWGDGRNPDYVHYTLEMANLRQHNTNTTSAITATNNNSGQEPTFQCVYKGTALGHRVNRLHEEMAYRFRINASSDAGIGEFSTLYEFTTSLAPPAPLKVPKVVDVQSDCCTIEWMAAKNPFPDPIVYQIQLRKVKDDNFKQMYRKEDCRLVMQDLASGIEYTVRVCPIRMSANGELPGTFSPLLKFTTVPLESTIATKSSNHLNAHKKGHNHNILLNAFHAIRAMLIDQPMFYTVLITTLGIIIALLIIPLFS